MGSIQERGWRHIGTKHALGRQAAASPQTNGLAARSRGYPETRQRLFQRYFPDTAHHHTGRIPCQPFPTTGLAVFHVSRGGRSERGSAICFRLDSVRSQ